MILNFIELYFQEILEKAAASLKRAEQGAQRAAKPVIEMSAQNDSLQIQTVTSGSRNTGVAAMDIDSKKVYLLVILFTT